MNDALKGNPVTLLDASESDGFSDALNVKGYEDMYLQVNGDADGKIYVHASQAGTFDCREAPDFTDDSTASNPHTQVQVLDTKDMSAVDGDDGIALTGVASTNNRLFKVNLPSLSFLCVELADRTSGSVSVQFVGFVRN